MATAPAAHGDDSGRDDASGSSGSSGSDDDDSGLEPGAELAEEAARYARLGWMRATSGNLSVVVGTDPVRILVTAADVVELDGAGVPTGRTPTGLAATPSASAGGSRTGDRPRQPSAEAILHARLIGLTGAAAVVHLHTVASVLAADRFPDGLTLRDHEMLKALGRAAEGDPVRLPVVTNSQDMAVLAERVSAAWEPATPAALIARHGMYVWGADLLAVRHRAEAVEWLCEWAVRTAEQTVSWPR
ncbi:class II aldolase/adducin family protein [Candidatus Frankia alpina]|uniref:Aldolase n=1 Tax=Candidatus Frankia alpina TaxID=2699483 RepID=A0A4S5CRF0_9ACTN|nr:class II aldolase/adducin family protein [Candidatus Frankia alpina]THJ48549.1 aldolase [Candidatus Frankia alpina]